jgi:hypothetical protein
VVGAVVEEEVEGLADQEAAGLVVAEVLHVVGALADSREAAGAAVAGGSKD